MNHIYYHYDEDEKLKKSKITAKELACSIILLFVSFNYTQ